MTPSYWTHLPAGERHHARAECDVVLVERRAAETGLGGHGPDANDATRLRVAEERGHVEHLVRDLEALGRPLPALGLAGARRRGHRVRRALRALLGDRRLPAARAPGVAAPVEITVTRSSSPRLSSMTAPKMMLASFAAAAVTTSAASFASNRPMSPGPVTLSRMPVAVDRQSSNGETRCCNLGARPSPLAVPMPIIAVPASRMIVRTSAKSRLTRPGS
jgi:hypothetical protein